MPDTALAALWSGMSVVMQQMLVPNLWWIAPLVIAALVLSWPARIPVRTERFARERTWRSFKFAPRALAFARAGNRCEHRNLLNLRCPAPASEIDHIWPFSRGGATVIGNAQALCMAHNRSKGSQLPTWWSVRYLLAARARYAPDDVDITVWR